MKEYTPKQIKELKKNPYVYKVTKHKLYYTAKFKEDFWISYQAGNAPRKILLDFENTMVNQLEKVIEMASIKCEEDDFNYNFTFIVIKYESIGMFKSY